MFEDEFGNMFYAVGYYRGNEYYVQYVSEKEVVHMQEPYNDSTLEYSISPTVSLNVLGKPIEYNN